MTQVLEVRELAFPRMSHWDSLSKEECQESSLFQEPFQGPPLRPCLLSVAALPLGGTVGQSEH
jgi:hypothetical protein